MEWITSESVDIKRWHKDIAFNPIAGEKEGGDE